jgi:hypothetical protein
MAATLAVGNYVRLRVWTQFAAEKQAAVNTAWYTVAAAGASASTDQDFADYMDANIGPAYYNLMSSLTDYRGVQVTINQTTYPYRQTLLPVAATAFAGPGTNGAQPLPSQIAGLIRFQTANAGSAGRGRWYVAFPTANGNSGGGTPTGAYQAYLATLAGIAGVGISLTTGGRTATLVRQLMHSPPKGGGPVPGPSPVLSFSESDLWATQKRRGSFGRTNVSPI